MAENKLFINGMSTDYWTPALLLLSYKTNPVREGYESNALLLSLKIVFECIIMQKDFMPFGERDIVS